MPPVNPRVFTVISKEEEKELKRIAKRLDVPVSWIARQALRKVISARKQSTRDLRNWLSEIHSSRRNSPVGGASE